MKTKPVAAVYDRRMENKPTAHRKPLQVVAAVYDRRAVRRFANIICLLLFFPFLSLSAAPQKQAAPPVDPTFVHDTIVKVLRGGTCEVPLRAISPQGYDVEFKTIPGSGPRAGSLSGPQRNSKSSVSYFYTHDGKKNSFQDSFRIKAKSGPQKAWGYAKVTILVEEPPARFAADVSSLDFGSVFLGESRTLPVRMTNAGGGKLQGNLKVGAPWRLADPSSLTLAEGEVKKILITFEPLSTDTQRGSLTFESGNKPFPEIALQGVGESRFEVPEKAAFEQHIGAKELRIPVKNLTAAPLAISVHCLLPLESPASLDLAPESTGELILTLPPRPFAEQNTVITLSDGTAARDMRIQLPPPPSRLEWEILGKRQFDEASPGRLEQLTAKLHNTGSGTANVVLRLEGGGIALDPDQPANLMVVAGESVTVTATWKFPDTPGLAEAVLVAETTGLPPLQTSWQADVQLPSAAPSPSPTPGPSPSPTPKAFSVLTPAEKAELSLLLPDNIRYTLAPHWKTATATILWDYHGPSNAQFTIEKEGVERAGDAMANPFQKRLVVPEELPKPELRARWSAVGPDSIQQREDGTWIATITDLKPGYHSIRIVTRQAGGNRIDYSSFAVRVGTLPPSPYWRVAMLFVFLLCTGYLFRNKIRSLFR